jgi:hypothetical protein
MLSLLDLMIISPYKANSSLSVLIEVASSSLKPVLHTMNS